MSSEVVHDCKYVPAHHTYDGVMGQAIADALETVPINAATDLNWEWVGLAVNGLDPVSENWSSFRPEDSRHFAPIPELNSESEGGSIWLVPNGNQTYREMSMGEILEHVIVSNP